MISARKILIVSAVHDNVELIVRFLKPHGLQPSSVLDNGMAALELLAREPHDLVLCDYQLKLMNGWLCVKEIKSSAKIANVPTILFGREKLPDDKASFEEYGVVRYLQFPTTQVTFDATLNSTWAVFKTSGTVESKYTMAKSALISDASTDAIELYGELNHLTKSSSRSSIGLAQAYEQNHENAKANEVLLNAAAKGAITPSGQILMLSLLLAQGRHPEANAVASELYNANPGPYFFLEAVKLLHMHKSFVLVEKFCAKAITEKYLIGDFWLFQARLLFSNNKLEQALQILNDQEEIFGRNPEVFNLKGTIFRKQQNFGSALHAYQQAMRLAPTDVKIFYNLAMCNLEMDDEVTAENHLEAALKIQPHFNLARNMLDDIRRKRAS